MTQDEILDIAKQAHRKLITEIYPGHLGQLNAWEIELIGIVAKLVAAKEQARCCSIVYGMAGSDNVAQRTVDAIRKND